MVKFLVTLLLFLALLIVLKNSNFFLKKNLYKENNFKIKEEKNIK